MRCPYCVEEHQPQHKVWFDSSTETLATTGDTFWDEDDLAHRHNPNVIVTNYHCSNGHRWAERFRQRCPVQSCEFNEELREP